MTAAAAPDPNRPTWTATLALAARIAQLRPADRQRIEATLEAITAQTVKIHFNGVTDRDKADYLRNQA
jgi:hypothetical protein